MKKEMLKIIDELKEMIDKNFLTSIQKIKCLHKLEECRLYLKESIEVNIND